MKFYAIACLLLMPMAGRCMLSTVHKSVQIGMRCPPVFAHQRLFSSPKNLNAIKSLWENHESYERRYTHLANQLTQWHECHERLNERASKKFWVTEHDRINLAETQAEIYKLTEEMKKASSAMNRVRQEIRERSLKKREKGPRMLAHPDWIS